MIGRADPAFLLGALCKFSRVFAVKLPGGTCSCQHMSPNTSRVCVRAFRQENHKRQNKQLL